MLTLNLNEAGLRSELLYLLLITRASFCCTKIQKKLHLILTKVAFIFNENCRKKLDLDLCTTSLNNPDFVATH